MAKQVLFALRSGPMATEREERLVCGLPANRGRGRDQRLTDREATYQRLTNREGDHRKRLMNRETTDQRLWDRETTEQRLMDQETTDQRLWDREAGHRPATQGPGGRPQTSDSRTGRQATDQRLRDREATDAEGCDPSPDRPRSAASRLFPLPALPAAPAGCNIWRQWSDKWTEIGSAPSRSHCDARRDIGFLFGGAAA